MWEWRIFYQHNPPTLSDCSPYIETQLAKATVEHRTDFYYNFFNTNYGLKERGPVNSIQFIPSLELKVLLEKRGDNFELWNKYFKIPMHRIIDSNRGLGPQAILDIIRNHISNYNLQESKYIREIITKLEQDPPPRILIEKTRKQIFFRYGINNKSILSEKSDGELLWLERTDFIYLNQKWNSFALECGKFKPLKSFIDNHLIIRGGIMAGYPEFIKTIDLNFPPS